MKVNYRISLSIIFLIVFYVFNTALAEENKTYKIGDIVPGKELQAYEPPLKAGMKYTFVSNLYGMPYQLPPREESTEIIAISEELAKVRLSGTNKEVTERLIPVSEFEKSGVIYLEFSYHGKETVNVPFRSFKNADKFLVENTANILTLWLIKNIGVVKLKEVNKVSKSIIITELKDFRAGN